MKQVGQYTGALGVCWKCGTKTPWWHWPGVPFCETPPPEPKPRVVQFRYSKQFGGSYWLNTCIQCGAVQGDNFVFLDPKSPLYSLPRRELPSDVGPAKDDGVTRVIRQMVGLPPKG
jgi:hypothetical protein